MHLQTIFPLNICGKLDVLEVLEVLDVLDVLDVLEVLDAKLEL